MLINGYLYLSLYWYPIGINNKQQSFDNDTCCDSNRQNLILTVTSDGKLKGM